VPPSLASLRQPPVVPLRSSLCSAPVYLLPRPCSPCLSFYSPLHRSVSALVALPRMCPFCLPSLPCPIWHGLHYVSVTSRPPVICCPQCPLWVPSPTSPLWRGCLPPSVMSPPSGMSPPLEAFGYCLLHAMALCPFVLLQ